ncbi:protein shifted-like [Saccostrea cucullata]|uniref:protein shifted-like n=1 Tax=Saccostrea cuccullata TaxID=36930 RepID=UPI002ED2D72A
MKILTEIMIYQSIYVLVSSSSDTCTTIFCRNGGYCEEGRCVCQEGFYGIRCEDECDGPDSCNNHGACVGIPRKCECDIGYQPTGYYGKHCEDSCHPSVNGSCGFAGTCSGAPHRCVCKQGFHGPWCVACTLDIHCKHGGTCNSDGTCTCKKVIPEIRGLHCEEVCVKDSDCMNAGKCLPNKTCKCTKFEDGFRCISAGNRGF